MQTSEFQQKKVEAKKNIVRDFYTKIVFIKDFDRIHDVDDIGM